MKKHHYNISIRQVTLSDRDAVVLIYKNGWLQTYPNKLHGISVSDIQNVVSGFTTTGVHKGKFVAEISGEELIFDIAYTKNSSCNVTFQCIK